MSQLELSNLSDLKISPSNDFESGQNEAEKKVPYPKSVFFIIATELSERFSYYGMRAVLTIYMRNVLKFSEDTATTLYHTFLLLCYGLPVIWGIIADSFLGKYRTILFVSIFFALGNITLTVSSIPPLHLPAIPLAMVGLALMAIGTGGMKPCVAPFGGEQFTLPQQAKYLQQFFSVFFFAVTVGNMISTVITPIFRRDVSCFGTDSCYPLAFGVPAVIMIFAVGVFVSGKSLYKITKPEGNMLVKVVRCIAHALMNKKYSDDVKDHWLDYADDKFDAGLINDIKMLLRVLVYYIPIPMFFALYEQLGSRWTLQATRMSGQLTGSFSIKPDQMQVSNAIFMFIFIPVFQGVIYPLFRKCRMLTRPLQRMGVGGFLAALSFLVAGIVETQIEKNHYTPPSGMEAHIKFVNTLPCQVSVAQGFNDSAKIGPEDFHLLKFSSPEALQISLSLNKSCGVKGIVQRELDTKFSGLPGYLQTAFLVAKDGKLSVLVSSTKEDFMKSNEGNSKLKVIALGEKFSQINAERYFSLKSSSGEVHDLNTSQQSQDFGFTLPIEVTPGEYIAEQNFRRNETTNSISSHVSTSLGKVDLHPGGVYILVIHGDYDDSNELKIQTVVINPPNEVHMLWLIPQYMLMAWAEILFIVSGMEFSFTQAPKSMKSVLQSLWHLMNAFGNVIVILSAQAAHVHSQATEFFEFSGAMFVDTIIFCLLAMRYKYVDTMVHSTSFRDRNDNKGTRN